MDHQTETTWHNAFKVMKSNYALTDDAIGVFAINLRFNLDDIQTIVTEAITGAGTTRSAMSFMSTKNVRSLSLHSAICLKGTEMRRQRVRLPILIPPLLGSCPPIWTTFPTC